MTAHRVPKSPCPRCAYVMDHCTAVAAASAPRPGDVSICINCGLPLKFGPELLLERLTLEDFGELDGETVAALCRARTAVILANRHRGMH